LEKRPEIAPQVSGKPEKMGRNRASRIKKPNNQTRLIRHGASLFQPLCINHEYCIKMTRKIRFSTAQTEPEILKSNIVKPNIGLCLKNIGLYLKNIGLCFVKVGLCFWGIVSCLFTVWWKSSKIGRFSPGNRLFLTNVYICNMPYAALRPPWSVGEVPMGYCGKKFPFRGGKDRPVGPAGSGG
jgi:hypothetical protein